MVAVSNCPTLRTVFISMNTTSAQIADPMVQMATSAECFSDEIPTSIRSLEDASRRKFI
jgi:hypothetical protein